MPTPPNHLWPKYNMPEPDFNQVPEAKTVPKRRLHVSIVWIIPIVASVAGLWIVATEIFNKGPEIRITFVSAEGIEAHKTKINYNGIHIGTVTGVELAEDHKHVIATARIHPSAKDILVKDTKFWVVKARVSGLNITRLGTLISGDYLGVQLGHSQESVREFIADEVPPLDDTLGRHFTLKTARMGSLGPGTPVLLRQLAAGQVETCDLDKSGDFLKVRIFIQAPYDRYVTKDTRFWHASGIDLSVSTGGLHVQTESLMTILAGGIAFETPAADSPQPPAAKDATFPLFNDRADAFKPQTDDPHFYVFDFKQPIRGLAVGAAVEFRGIPIGEVTRISPQIDAKTGELTVSVTAHISPEKYDVTFVNALPSLDELSRHKRVMDALVRRGLRAQLKTASLLTGARFVSVDFMTNEPAATLDWSRIPVQLPTVSGAGGGLEDDVKGLMDKVQSAMAGAQAALTNMQAEFSATFANARGTLTNADNALAKASTVLTDAHKLIEPNSPLNAELNELLLQGGDAARALRVLADYLERHPEALIRGKTGQVK